MASPQTENGYARIANELLQAIYRFPFSGQELRVILWVIRTTYGWKGRTETPTMTLRVIAEQIGIPVATAGWAIKGLCDRAVLVRLEDGSLRPNKNYDEWLLRGEERLPLLSYPAKMRAAQKPSAAAAPARKDAKRPEPEGFKPPTLEEVQAYCIQRKSVVDPEKFHAHYESKDWMVGRSRMTNWKSSVCYWERTTHAAVKEARAAGKPCPLCETHPLPYPNAIVCDKCGPRCRACNKQTAKLKIVRRRDGTKTAECAAGCDASELDAVLPKATKQLDAERNANFMAARQRRLTAREK